MCQHQYGVSRVLFTSPSRLVAAPFALLLVLVAFGTLLTSRTVSAFSPHDPIAIDGDPAFTSANGVVSGSGTPDDPYVIEGWEIASPWFTGMDVRNTRAAFVVRNVYVHTETSSQVGLNLVNVSGARIESSVLSRNWYGLVAESVTDLVVSGSEISNNVFGLRLVSLVRSRIDANNITQNEVAFDWSYPLYNVTFSANDITNNRNAALDLVSGSNVTVKSNRFVSNGEGIRTSGVIDGFELTGNDLDSSGAIMLQGTNITARANRVFRGPYGLSLTGAGNATLADNEISESSGFGIMIERSAAVRLERNIIHESVSNLGIWVTLSSDVEIHGNRVERRMEGISIVGSARVVVWGNSLLGNGQQAADDASGPYSWDMGYPTGGNYWSDYDGVDVCSGPAQDVCDMGDNIGDTPYVIDTDSMDRYPWLPPNSPPVASFGYFPAAIFAGDPVFLDGTASTDPDGLIEGHSWDFGDGTTGSGAMIVHYYPSPGSYTVTLTVTDDRGGTTSVSGEVVIAALPDADFVVLNHSTGFLILAPRSWSVQRDWVFQNTTFELVLTGPISGSYPPTVLVDWEADPTVRETPELLNDQATKSISGLVADDPSLYVVQGPRLRQIGGHAAFDFVVQENSTNSVLKYVVVVSDIHDSFWLFALRATLGEYHYNDAILEKMLTGFLITRPASSPIGSDFLVLLLLPGAGAGVAASVVITFVVRRRRRFRPGGPPETP